jgi:hydrogenase maturation factor
MKRYAFFDHAGCPVCVAAEQQLADAIDPSRFDVEIVHLGEARTRIPGPKWSG